MISYMMLVITLRTVLTFVAGVPKLPPLDKEELSHVINELLSPRVTTAVSSVHSIVVLSVSHFFQKCVCGCSRFVIHVISIARHTESYTTTNANRLRFQSRFAAQFLFETRPDFAMNHIIQALSNTPHTLSEYRVFPEVGILIG